MPNKQHYTFFFSHKNAHILYFYSFIYTFHRSALHYTHTIGFGKRVEK